MHDLYITKKHHIWEVAKHYEILIKRFGNIIEKDTL